MWGKCEETEQRSQTRQSSARCEHACVSVWSRRSRRDRHTSSSCPRASAAPAASAAATTACPRNTPSHTASLNPDKHTLHYSQFSPYSITVGHGLDSQGMHELQVKVQVALDESICQMHKCKLLFMDNFKNGKNAPINRGCDRCTNQHVTAGVIMCCSSNTIDFNKRFVFRPIKTEFTVIFAGVLLSLLC